MFVLRLDDFDLQHPGFAPVPALVPVQVVGQDVEEPGEVEVERLLLGLEADLKSSDSHHVVLVDAGRELLEEFRFVLDHVRSMV